LGEYYRETITEADREPVDVVAVLRENQVDVLVSYPPVGSEEADKFYAQCAIDAGVGFVNALPVFIASDPVWAQNSLTRAYPPIRLEYKLEVWDCPNSAGIIIDALRVCKLAMDRGMGGPVLSASSYFMKSPPVQYDDSTAREEVERFLRG
jgi:myo-inositol-1-phosphate synthase